MYGFMQRFNRNLCDVWMNMVNVSSETTEGSIIMEVIEREDLKALNIELFRSKLYFRLDLKEGDFVRNISVNIRFQDGWDE